MSERGVVSVHPRGFGFVELDDGRLAFVAPPALRPFLTGDRVDVDLATSDKGLVARTIRLVERRRARVFGEVAAGKLRVDRDVSNADWPIDTSLLGAMPRDGALATAELIGDRARIDRVVAPTEAGLHRVVVRHDLRFDFPNDVLASVEPAAHRAHDEMRSPRRRDLRTLPTVTIDAASTKDIDDALSVIPAGDDGALRLFVSIADVDAGVAEGSPLDVEARTRATSVYLADLVLPMLPHALSERALSLLEGEDRPAMTVEMRIDAEGNVTSVDVYESIVRSHARLTYDAVTKLLDEQDLAAVPTQVASTLRWLRTAAARISAVRQGRGGVSIAGDEVHVAIDATTREPTAAIARSTTSAHVLVERLMVAANESVARWLVDRGLPGTFRVHDAPDAERVGELATFARNFGFEPGFARSLTPLGLAAFEAQWRGTAVAPAMQNVLGRALGPARYTVHAGLHFGLAAPLYLHFTSPIRRYADLVVHRVIKRFLGGARDFHAGDPRIESLAEHLNDRARTASRAENERSRMLTARLYASRIGERTRGNVVAIKPFGLVVQLRDSGVTATIAHDTLPGGPYRSNGARTELIDDHDHRFAIGAPLSLVVTGANEALGRIELALDDAR